MTEKRTTSAWSFSNPIVWGLLATFAIVGLGVWTSGLPTCIESDAGLNECGVSKWHYFLSAKPNEVGDTLAGFAGAMAFVWIIVTVWLQSAELSAQRMELELSREEFKKMAEAQDAQVQILRAQSEELLKEQKILHEEYWAKQADELLGVLKSVALDALAQNQRIEFGSNGATDLILHDHASVQFSSGQGMKAASVHKILAVIDDALENLVDSQSNRIPIVCPQLDEMYQLLKEYRTALNQTSLAKQLASEFSLIESFSNSLGTKLERSQ